MLSTFAKQAPWTEVHPFVSRNLDVCRCCLLFKPKEPDSQCALCRVRTCGPCVESSALFSFLEICWLLLAQGNLTCRKIQICKFCLKRRPETVSVLCSAQALSTTAVFGAEHTTSFSGIDAVGLNISLGRAAPPELAHWRGRSVDFEPKLTLSYRTHPHTATCTPMFC